MRLQLYMTEVPMFKVPRDNSDIKALERIVAKEIECLNKDQQCIALP